MKKQSQAVKAFENFFRFSLCVRKQYRLQIDKAIKMYGFGLEVDDGRWVCIGALFFRSFLLTYRCFVSRMKGRQISVLQACSQELIFDFAKF